MLKMLAGTPPDQILAIGLSFHNLDEFKAHPNDTYIRIKSEDSGVPIDVILHSGLSMRAKGQQDTRDVLMIGFSLEEIDAMRQNPGRIMHRIKKETYEIPMDILIFSGETEITMTHALAELIGPETRVSISERLKN